MRRGTRSLRKGKFVVLAAVPVISAFFTTPSIGQTLTWDASGANPTAPTDGSGSWNTTTNATWSDGVNNSVWVNGDVAHPLYKYLKSKQGPAVIEENYAKFLVDKNGQVVKRYLNVLTPMSFEKDIVALL